MTPNEKILIIREKYIQLYKSYERIILPIVKFSAVLIILLNINSTIGIMQSLAKPVATFIMALIAGFLSPSLIMIMIMGVVVAHTLSFNLILGVGILAIFCTIYVLFIRLYPKESLLILVTLVAFKFKMEYAVLLIVPLFGGLACLVSLILGIVFSFANPHVIGIIQRSNISEPIEDMAISLVNVMVQTILLNKDMLTTIAIFIIVFMIVYIIRNLPIDYAPYVAIAVGAVMNLVGFGMGILFLELNMNVLILILMTILSIILALIVKFLSSSLDYSRAEVVQFEDEDNYYYVKVVPKVCVSTNNTKIEQVYTTTTKEDFSNFTHKDYME